MSVSIHNYIQGRSAVKISDSIEAAIREGRLEPGGALPTVRALAETLGVSPTTVASAYRRLRTRGLLVAEGRRGTRVTRRPPLPVRAASVVPAHLRNLKDGNPDPKMLPGLGHALRKLDTRPRLYAEVLNDRRLISLAERELAHDGIPTDHLGISAGALDGIERVLRERLRPGDRVAVEDPCYSGIFDLIGSLGLVPIPVELDGRGMRPGPLDTALEAGALAVIVTPRAQNPTGAFFDQQRARELKHVLRLYPDILLIEDDHAGPVSGAPLFSLCHRRRSHWAFIRSVSKFLGPDLRVAVMAGDEETMARVEGRQVLGIRWVSHILQNLVYHLWSRCGTERLLEKAERTYGRRRDALLDALGRRSIPARGASGLNVWIPVANETHTVQMLAEAGWAVQGGEPFRIDSPPAIRVTIADLEVSEADRLAADLGAALQPLGRTLPS